MVHKNQANHKKAFHSKVNRPLSKIYMGEGEHGPPVAGERPKCPCGNGRGVPSELDGILGGYSD